MDYFLRPATLQDLPELAAIERACFPEAEAATEEQIRDRLSHYADGFCVAVSAGQIVAFADGMCTNEPDLRDEMYADASLHDPKGKWQMIFGVNTLPEFRRQGIASEMLKRYQKRAWAKGQYGLVLTCKEEKIPFYAALGFVDEGVSESDHGGVVWHQMRYTIPANLERAEASDEGGMGAGGLGGVYTCACCGRPFVRAVPGQVKCGACLQK